MNWFKNLAHKIAAFFGTHQDAIQRAVGIAKVATTTTIGVVAALGDHPALTKVLAGVSDGLDRVAATVTAESTASTLAEHATNLTGLAEGLIQTTNDVGVKNADTKAAIGRVLTKVNNVVGALEAAHDAQAPDSLTPPPPTV